MSRLAPVCVLACCLVVVFASIACSGRPSANPPPRPTGSDPSPSSRPDGIARAGQGRTVAFPALDGVGLVGKLFGSGRVGVVLSHMGRFGDSQVDWFPVAKALAGRGYGVLTYNRREICNPDGGACSGGTDDLAASWQDVVGAVNFLRSRGARRVVVGGASIGAMASLAALLRSTKGDALIWFAGILDGELRFSRRGIQEARVPALIVSTRNDDYSADVAARKLSRWWPQQADLVLLPGAGHGTDVLSDLSRAKASRFLSALTRFLSRI